MMKVLDFCGSLKDVGKKICVLADMKELGEEAVKAHETIGETLAASDMSSIFLVGECMCNAYRMLAGHKGTFWYEVATENNYKKIAERINGLAEDKDVILLKGSHSMQLERLVPLLCSTEGENK